MLFLTFLFKLSPRTPFIVQIISYPRSFVISWNIHRIKQMHMLLLFDRVLELITSLKQTVLMYILVFAVYASGLYCQFIKGH